MAKKYYGSSRQEDGGMLKEDHSKVANLPQDVKYISWPSMEGDYMDYSLNDRMSGVDNQMRDDSVVAKRNKSKSKY